MRRRGVIAIAGAVVLVVVAVAIGLRGPTGDDAASTTMKATTTELPAPDPLDRDRAAVVKVIESLRTGSPEGFDPEVWAQATDPTAVLPEGATLDVNRGSVIVDGRTAAADVVMSVPGEDAIRYWVFARRADDEWVVYGSMELEPQS